MSPAKRRALMQRIKSKNTEPELVVRRALHVRGIRYRLHVKLAGTRPDIVLRSHRVAILVHGCFWHGHNCHLFRWPKTRSDFWKEKISKNRARDRKVVRALVKEHWSVATVWECATRDQTPQHLHRLIDGLERWIRRTDRPQTLSLRGP